MLKLIAVFTVILPAMVCGGTSFLGFGQGLIGSPQYSYSAAALGRGGCEMAFIDSLGINQMNYALWSRFERTTISLGLSYSSLSTRSDFASNSSADAALRGGFLAIPLQQKKWVLGFGLMPLYASNFGIEVPEEAPGQTITRKVEAKGNISEALMLLSLKLSDRWAVALNGGYDFGIITDKISVLYSDQAYSDIVVYDEFQMRGLNFGLSAFYTLNSRASLGLKYKSRTKCTVNTERKSFNLPEPIKGEETITLPSLYAFGLDYKLNQRWQIGFDVIYQDWKQTYRVDDLQNDRISDSYRFGLGVERSPQDRRFVPYLQDISWRGGFFAGQANILVDNDPVIEYGIAGGLSLPIRKNRNRIDLTIEYGIRNNTGSTLLRENYFGISIALLSSELWFVRERR